MFFHNPVPLLTQCHSPEVASPSFLQTTISGKLPSVLQDAPQEISVMIAQIPQAQLLVQTVVLKFHGPITYLLFVFQCLLICLSALPGSKSTEVRIGVLIIHGYVASHTRLGTERLLNKF